MGGGMGGVVERWCRRVEGVVGMAAYRSGRVGRAGGACCAHTRRTFALASGFDEGISTQHVPT
jgi:hypothetical protein